MTFPLLSCIAAGLALLMVLAVVFLAVLAGVHYTSLVRLEAGRYDPRLSTLKKIAGALEVSVRDLLTEQQPTQQRRK